jgi:hypothetical protein
MNLEEFQERGKRGIPLLLRLNVMDIKPKAW